MSMRPTTTNTGPQPKGGGKKSPPRKTYGTAAKVSRRDAEVARQRERRRMAMFIVVFAVLIVAGGALGIVLAGGKSNSNGSTTAPTAAQAVSSGPEQVPIPSGFPLGGSNPSGKPIDGISCGGTEMLAYHVHAHLQIFIGGTQVQIPAGVGIVNPQGQQSGGGEFINSGSCYYWLHTHAADGIIHIESPTKKIYTLGTFFDIWGQPLGPTQVGPNSGGPVVAYVDGKPWTGNPRDITLQDKEQIQLDYGTPAPPYKAINFPADL